jgi:hypothetical protein
MQERLRFRNATNYSSNAPRCSDVVKKPALLSRGPSSLRFHFQRHELGQLTNAPVTDQIRGSHAQPSMQRPAVPDHHVARLQPCRDGPQIPCRHPGGLPCPSEPGVVSPESDVTTAAAQQDPLLNSMF